MALKKKRVKKTKIATSEVTQVAIGSDELDRLKECESLVERIEQCETLCDERSVRVEQAREELKELKGAYNAAVLELRRLCRARKEKHPLFDQPKKPAADVPMSDLSALRVTIKSNPVEIPPGLELSVLEILPGGIAVEHDGIRKELADEEYEAKFVQVAGSVFSPRVVERFIAEARTKLLEDKTAKQAEPQDYPLAAAGINGVASEKLSEAGIHTLGHLVRFMRNYGPWWWKEVDGIGEDGAGKLADSVGDFQRDHPEFCQAS